LAKFIGSKIWFSENKHAIVLQRRKVATMMTSNVDIEFSSSTLLLCAKWVTLTHSASDILELKLYCSEINYGLREDLTIKKV
jgi:hypothetical protein